MCNVYIVQRSRYIKFFINLIFLIINPGKCDRDTLNIKLLEKVGILYNY